jgi:hypothetical protein
MDGRSDSIQEVKAAVKESIPRMNEPFFVKTYPEGGFSGEGGFVVLISKLESLT